MAGTKTFSWNNEVDGKLREISASLGISQSEALRRCVNSYGPVSKDMIDSQIERKKSRQRELLEQASQVQDEIKNLEKMKNTLQQTLEKTDARLEWMKDQKKWYLGRCRDRQVSPSYDDAVSMLRVRYTSTRRKLGVELSELAVFASDIQELSESKKILEVGGEA